MMHGTRLLVTCPDCRCWRLPVRCCHLWQASATLAQLFRFSRGYPQKDARIFYRYTSGTHRQTHLHVHISIYIYLSVLPAVLKPLKLMVTKLTEKKSLWRTPNDAPGAAALASAQVSAAAVQLFKAIRDYQQKDVHLSTCMCLYIYKYIYSDISTGVS